MDLHSTPAMGAGITAARQRETGTAALSADMGRRMNPIRAGSASQCPSPCVGLDWRQVSQNQTEPFSLRRTCAGNAVITWCGRACWASLWKQDTSKKRAVRTACGGIVESAPEAAARSPLPASEKVTRTSRYFRVGITFPLAFCSPIDPRLATKVRSTGRRWGASKPVPATVRSGRLDWLPTLEEGGQRNL
jgi:hypothetical protein